MWEKGKHISRRSTVGHGMNEASKAIAIIEMNPRKVATDPIQLKMLASLGFAPRCRIEADKQTRATEVKPKETTRTILTLTESRVISRDSTVANSWKLNGRSISGILSGLGPIGLLPSTIKSTQPLRSLSSSSPLPPP